MKKSPQKAIMLFSLFCISTSVMADFRDRELGERYRERHRNMDICAEIKEDLLVAEEAYVSYADNITSTNQAIDAQRRQVNTKESELNRLQSAFDQANAHVLSLSKQKINKPELIQKAKKTISKNQSKRSAAVNDIAVKKKREKKECKGIRRVNYDCWGDARPAYEKAKKKLKNIDQAIASAKAQIQNLNQIDSKLKQANIVLKTAKNALTSEQNATPTLGQLKTKLDKMTARRDREHSDYAQVEARYGRLEVRAEKCIRMQYEAKKSKSFRNSLLAFAADNGAGCETAISRINNARGKAKRDGVNEAYQLVCKSDTLLRYEEVTIPSEPVPSQCNNDISTITLDTPFTTGSPYEANRRSDKRDGKGELKKVLTEPNAKMIRLKIEHIDVEAGYDFVIILDDQGNEVTRLTNKEDDRGNEVPYGEYDTGWIPGNTLTVMLYSDGRGERSGFTIEEFEVQY